MLELLHQNDFVVYPNAFMVSECFHGIRIVMQLSKYPSELSICFSSSIDLCLLLAVVKLETMTVIVRRSHLIFMYYSF